jgi:hypothetical protein
MAFPVQQSVTATAFAVASTTHNVDYPATVNAGDLLLMIFSANDGVVITTPTGYTQLDQQSGGTGAIRTGIFAKSAAGTEGGTSETVTIASSKTACAQVMRITGWGGSVALSIDISTYATGTSTVPNPGIVTAGGGVDDNLYLAVVGAADDDETVSNDPSTFEGLVSTVSGGGVNDGCTVGSAYKEDTSASLDPATFLLSGSEEWVTWTLVVLPSAAGGIQAKAMYHYRNHGKIF